MPKNSKRNSRRGSGRGGRKANPRSTALAFSGPIRAPPSATVTFTRVFANVVDVVANGTGLIQLGIACNPTSSGDWLAVAGNYVEYRLLGARVRYVPSFLGTSVAGITALPGVMVLSAKRDASISAPSQLNALETAAMRFGSVYRPLTLEMRSNGALEMMWLNTDSAAATNFTFALSSTGLTPSVIYGQYVLHLLIQFRDQQ